MSVQQRWDAIRKLEQLRSSRVLVHFLSDRHAAHGVTAPGVVAQLASDAYPYIYEHVRAFGHPEKLDLFIHTAGGHLDAVWPLVQLLRSVTQDFRVIVPMKALSGGTLICLGANTVVMTGPAQLSPIDPSTANAFNPGEGNQKIPISVEDVTSYLDLARGGEDSDDGASAGLKSDEHIVQVFKILAARVHPLALGNVKRVHKQIRAISRRLLELHLKGDDADSRISKIVKTLTEELQSHSHLIGRVEATDILGGDIVVAPTPEEEEAIWALFALYEQRFELRTSFSIKEWLGSDLEKDLNVIGGAIESAELSHLFRAKSKISQISQVPQGVQVQIPPGQRMPLVPGLPRSLVVEPISEGWYTNNEGD